MKRKKTSGFGFTLIELMVVVLIIALLSGMLLKISGGVAQKAARSRAIADLENIQNALNEFYTEYGMYPPTDRTPYVFESATNQTAYLRDYLERNNTPGETGFVPDMRGRAGQYGSPNGLEVGYQYGLVAYLYARARGGAQPHWYDADTPRDLRAKLSWAHYLEDVAMHGGFVPLTFTLQDSSQAYSNVFATIHDPWGHSYGYSSSPPFATYRLWSGGPTGSDEDDIRNDDYNE